MNLASRPDRWKLMNERWNKYFDLVQVNGIVLENDEREQYIRASDGLGQTHMKLIREAIERGDKTLLILEDDAIPEPNWFERWTELKSYLDSHLDDWEVFNGCAHQLKKCYDVIKLPQSAIIDGGICCASHFIYLNLKSAERFLVWETRKADIDVFYCCTGLILFTCYPILAKQADGHSDITNLERDWDETYISNEIHFKKHLGNIYIEYNIAKKY